MDNLRFYYREQYQDYPKHNPHPAAEVLSPPVLIISMPAVLKQEKGGRETANQQYKRMVIPWLFMIGNILTKKTRLIRNKFP
jgi:hypothetical protein